MIGRKREAALLMHDQRAVFPGFDALLTALWWPIIRVGTATRV